jgi:hypothetical protein
LGHAVLHPIDAIGPQLLAIRHAVLDLRAVGADLLPLGDAALHSLSARRPHCRTLHAAIHAVRTSRLTIDTRNTRLPFDPRSREALRTLHPGRRKTLSALHARGGKPLGTLHARSREALRAFHSRLSLSSRRPLDRLSALAAAAALICYSAAATTVAAARPGARRGRYRKRGNAGCEEYPGHIESPSERLNGP